MLGDMKRCVGRPVSIRPAAVLACALALAVAAGCGDGDGPGATGRATVPPATSSGPAASTAGTAPAATVTLYFSDDQGVLRAQRRAVAGAREPLEAAMAALADGPRDPALLPALPAGTRVLGVGRSGDEAVVDLSSEFESGYPPGGSAAELAVVGPVVRTAAEASGAARVRILVDGRTPAPPGSQIDFATPLAPGDLPGP